MLKLERFLDRSASWSLAAMLFALAACAGGSSESLDTGTQKGGSGGQQDDGAIDEEPREEPEEEPEEEPAASSPDLTIVLPEGRRTQSASFTLEAEVHNGTGHVAESAWWIEGDGPAFVEQGASLSRASFRVARPGRYRVSVAVHAGDETAEHAVTVTVDGSPHRYEGRIEKADKPFAGLDVALRWRPAKVNVASQITAADGSFRFENVLAPDEEFQILLAP